MKSVEELRSQAQHYYLSYTTYPTNCHQRSMPLVPPESSAVQMLKYTLELVDSHISVLETLRSSVPWIIADNSLFHSCIIPLSYDHQYFHLLPNHQIAQNNSNSFTKIRQQFQLKSIAILTPHRMSTT